MALITIEDMAEIAEAELPWVRMLGLRTERIGEGTASVRMTYRGELLRPGGTISGPALMGLADYAMYVAVLSSIGRVELAVTTNLSINFLRKPPALDVIADARLLKLGKRLAYGEVFLHSEGDRDGGPVAHVTATYSIPPNR